ncbi:hypothetical protein ACFOEE_02775 [Pseudoalteromonas fenneropenaei]|uniref:50S ribosomal protein L34 n=1 Tax=Pseudoalteromonas fenneropenaei TaxID=1737459 RepID=A0ABV7CFT2_9GAMM
MLKRRRTARFKRNVRNASPNRRRITLKNIHKKILHRRRQFAMIQVEEPAAQP